MDLHICNDHLVVCIDGNKYVVDTGSPWTFNYLRLSGLEIGGRVYPFAATPICTKESLDGLTGEDIAGIIGMDVICKTGLAIDLENRTLDFGAAKETDDPCAVLPFDTFMDQFIVADGISLGCASGERQLKNAIIDTGACVSYLSLRFVDCLTDAGEKYEDYSPDLNRYIRGKYYAGDLIMDMDGRKRIRAVKIGLMPQKYEQFGLFDAILGISALTDKRIVFDFSKRQIRVYL